MKRLCVTIPLCLSLAFQLQARQVINLSGSWLSKQATAPTVQTSWTYQPYSSFYETDKRFELTRLWTRYSLYNSDPSAFGTFRFEE